ncbi:LpxL/LpxP family acyltransferase [Taibaiella koreensis]|uniref:LpxL/LpxP family acyltransferase n=1 Tax=Taibaiella koreensis TaxID=1268548 RepID=UPI000E59F246|nr:lipid A biosynthesis acyltransferase [Taibaiella koreensis]
MSTWDGQSKGNRLGYSIFILLLRWGGITPAYWLLRFVVLYYLWFVPRATRPLRDLYRDRLQLGPAHTRRLIRSNILTFGQTIIDRIVVMSGQKHRFTVERTGGQYLNQLADGGQGGIIVSAHLGNYEMAGHLLQRLNSVINIVMYDGEAQQIKQYLDKVTGPKTFNIIFIKEDMSHIYEMSAALRRNELICIHADRYVPGNRTIAHSFLGAEAHFPLGPFVLASKLKAPVCFVFALKESKYGYHFYGNPPKVYEGRGTTGAEAMLADYVGLLEEKVKQYPEQWFNYFDFWAVPEAPAVS